MQLGLPSGDWGFRVAQSTQFCLESRGHSSVIPRFFRFRLTQLQLLDYAILKLLQDFLDLENSGFLSTPSLGIFLPDARLRGVLRNRFFNSSLLPRLRRARRLLLENGVLRTDLTELLRTRENRFPRVLHDLLQTPRE